MREHILFERPVPLRRFGEIVGQHIARMRTDMHVVVVYLLRFRRTALARFQVLLVRAPFVRRKGTG